MNGIRTGGGGVTIEQIAWAGNNGDSNTVTLSKDYKIVIVVITNGNKHTNANKAVGTISINPSRAKDMEKSSKKEGYGWFSSLNSCVFYDTKQGDIITVSAPAWLGYYDIYGIN